MPAAACCLACLWQRVVPGPTPLANGPYHWCGNLGGYHYSRPVTDDSWCAQFQAKLAGE